LIAIVLAIAVLSAAGYWWWSRNRRAGHLQARTARTRERFAAVEIRRRSGACAAAHALDGQRFLANQSPTLPLDGCTTARCDCAFVKLSDRRTDDRRFGGLGAAMFIKAQRRKRAGRRDRD
jgi:hypothetical protein